MASKKPVTTPMRKTVLVENISIAKSLQDLDSQMVIMGRLKVFIKQIKGNQEVFNNKLESIGANKIKMPLIKRFNRTRVKFKGYLIQMTLKLKYEKDEIETVADAVAYVGLFLTR